MLDDDIFGKGAKIQCRHLSEPVRLLCGNNEGCGPSKS